MDKPLRIDTFTYMSEHLIEGMFIFNKRNSIDYGSHILSIIHYIEENLFLVMIKDREIYFESENLKENVHDGDILVFHKNNKKISTYLTSTSNENTIMVTERCNSRCLFCCQPPKNENDEYLFDNAFNAIVNFNTNKYIGISGGEPTYNKDIFFELFKKLNNLGNSTPFHILTNGKTFEDYEFTKNICNVIASRDVIWAIPIYGHNSSIHDKIVVSKGSFDKTTKGIIHLLEFGQNIEIRIIPNQLNIKYLENIIDYLYSTFKFINNISIMNIEPIGYARKNYDELYLKVNEQNKFLKKAIFKARLFGFNIALYNYPLCLLSDELRNYSIKSISDWKNYFPSNCDNCSQKLNCCGFFTSANDKYIEKVTTL